MQGVDFAIINKTRNIDGKCQMNGIEGEVANKNRIIIDGIIDAASTLCGTAELLIATGASSATACVTHAILTERAIQLIENSTLQKI